MSAPGFTDVAAFLHTTSAAGIVSTLASSVSDGAGLSPAAIDPGFLTATHREFTSVLELLGEDHLKQTVDGSAGSTWDGWIHWELFYQVTCFDTSYL